MHTPVLLEETLKILDPKSGQFVIDGTVDGGGHAELILERLGTGGKLLGLDLDPVVLNQCKSRLSRYRNADLILGNYADLPSILTERKLPKADGLLLDLGFSSEQLISGRGFSFDKDEPLLMTYSDEMVPLRDLLPKLREEELADIIYKFGEERFSRRIAKAIKSKRNIQTSKELADAIRAALPGSYEHGRINPATRTFQALRIYANHEFENLEKVLDELPEILKPGGTAAIISFHSLEDRIVKNKLKDMAKEKRAELIMKKPIAATREEIRENPRSRSAKLRAVTIL